MFKFDRDLIVGYLASAVNGKLRGKSQAGLLGDIARTVLKTIRPGLASVSHLTV